MYSGICSRVLEIPSVHDGECRFFLTLFRSQYLGIRNQVKDLFKDTIYKSNFNTMVDVH